MKDIYPLAPLQEGILFHHLFSKTDDPYVLRAALSFETKAKLDEFLTALQVMVDRHDIFRPAFLWEGLSQPAQVVLRRVDLVVETREDESFDSDICRFLAGETVALDVHHAARRIAVARDTSSALDYVDLTSSSYRRQCVFEADF